jgi:lipoprotein-anchoring transpeptidase ErfK/SrfK
MAKARPRVSGRAQCVCADTGESGQSYRKSFEFSRFRLACGLHFFPAQVVQETREDAMTARTLNMMAAVLLAAVLAEPLAAQSANRNASQNPNQNTNPGANQIANHGVNRNTNQGATANEPAAAQHQVPDAQVQPAATKRVIVVSLEDHKLALVEDGKVKKIYSVAVGKPSTPSPVGTYTIARRVMNPTYSHDGRIVPPGPNNPVGTRWMGLSIPGYGIHGTNVPSSIGKAASHGCIRMAKKDLEELYPMVEVGDAVELIGERNEETAQVFGDAPTLVPGAQPATLTAMAAAEELPIAAPQLSITAPPAAHEATNSATLPSVLTTTATATLSSPMFAGSL